MREATRRSVVLCLCLSACGGDRSIEAEPATDLLLYDEATSGSLPRGLSQLSAAEITRVTFKPPEGTSVVRGTSSVGESFLVELSASTYIEAVLVRFTNQSTNNDHILQITPYPFRGVGSIFVSTPMPTLGSYDFKVPIKTQSIGAGVFEVYTGTSVSGPPVEYSFSLTFVVAKR